MIRTANYYRMVGMILLIGAVVVCPSAAYPSTLEHWTTVGSAGTVDDADYSLAVFSGPTVTVNPSVDVATLDIRYNVVEVAGLDVRGMFYFKARFRDNGASAQVIANLKRHDVLAGTTITLQTFDSNDFTASNNFWYAGYLVCLDGFDFYNYDYYIEVALKKFGSAGNPALSSILLYGADYPCP